MATNGIVECRPETVEDVVEVVKRYSNIQAVGEGFSWNRVRHWVLFLTHMGATGIFLSSG